MSLRLANQRMSASPRVDRIYKAKFHLVVSVGSVRARSVYGSIFAMITLVPWAQSSRPLLKESTMKVGH